MFSTQGLLEAYGIKSRLDAAALPLASTSDPRPARASPWDGAMVSSGDEVAKDAGRISASDPSSIVLGIQEDCKVSAATRFS